MSDPTIAILRQALHGLSVRQRSITDNLANLETPNYLAKRVDFESSLQAAMGSGDPSKMNVSTNRTMDPTGLNGNNVNLDDETILASDTALRYELTVEALNAKYRLMRIAIRGQG
jgi:flagellar basal-body rod protein FlgB